jgi:ketosteroid isomerase-like protein
VVGRFVTHQQPEIDHLLAEVADAISNVDWDTAAHHLTEDAVFDWSRSRGPYRGVYRGHAEVRRLFDSFSDVWDERAWEFTEAIPVAPGKYVVLSQMRALSKGGGVPLEASGAAVWTLRDGKVAGWELFQSKDEALAAAEAA